METSEDDSVQPASHGCNITSLIMGLASSAILFGVGTAIALVVNYPVQKTQRKVISSLAPDMISLSLMSRSLGVLNGPEDVCQMLLHSSFVSVIPESWDVILQ